MRRFYMFYTTLKYFLVASVMMSAPAWAAKHCDENLSLQTSPVKLASSIADKLEKATAWIEELDSNEQFELLFSLVPQQDTARTKEASKAIALQLLLRNSRTKDVDVAVKSKMHFTLLSKARMVEQGMREMSQDLIQSDQDFVNALVEIALIINQYPKINLRMLNFIEFTIVELQHVADISKQNTRYYKAHRSNFPGEIMSTLAPVHRSQKEKAIEYQNLVALLSTMLSTEARPKTAKLF